MKPSLLPSKKKNGRTTYPKQPTALHRFNYSGLRNNASETRIGNRLESRNLE